jgi:hypothetical protein
MLPTETTKLVQRVSTMSYDYSLCPTTDPAIWPDAQVTELLLLLPARHAARLESLAHSREMTVGHLIRLLVGKYLADHDGPSSIGIQEGTGGITAHRDVCYDVHEPNWRRDDR